MRSRPTGMWGFAALAIFVPSATTVNLVHVRPSSLLARICMQSGISPHLITEEPLRLDKVTGPRGMIPAGVRALADDASGQLIFDGDPEVVAQLAQAVHIFDVERKTVRAAIHVESPQDHVSYDMKVDLRNNAEWSFDDRDLELHERISTRINQDGTITVYLTSKVDATSGNNIIFRVKWDATTRIVWPRNHPEKMETTTDLGQPVKAADPIILTLRFSE